MEGRRLKAQAGTVTSAVFGIVILIVITLNFAAPTINDALFGSGATAANLTTTQITLFALIMTIFAIGIVALSAREFGLLG